MYRIHSDSDRYIIQEVAPGFANFVCIERSSETSVSVITKSLIVQALRPEIT